MKCPTEIKIRIMTRPDLCNSKHIVADITVGGELYHWPLNEALGVGMLFDETQEREGLNLFLQYLAAHVAKLTLASSQQPLAAQNNETNPKT